VCDDNFHYADAAVACRQLGLGRVLKVWSRGRVRGRVRGRLRG